MFKSMPNTLHPALKESLSTSMCEMKDANVFTDSDTPISTPLTLTGDDGKEDFMPDLS